MKKLPILVLFSIFSASAQTSSTVSRSVILTPRRDATPPHVRIIEPQPNTGGKVVATERWVSVVAFASDESGIQLAKIDDQSVAVSPNGRFSYRAPLREGKNEIPITVEDSAGNAAVTSVAVWYDTSPPSIQIIEPDLAGTRGMRVIAETTTVIRAKVFDESGIQTVLLNGEAVSLMADSTFTRAIPLKEGENDIRVSALDNCGKRSDQQLILVGRRPDLFSQLIPGKISAVIIGIDKYSGKWPRLKNAVADAKAVETTLRNEFRFDRIITLYDAEATRERIIPLFESLYETLGKDDNLLVYFSGHGVLDKRTNKGYWVPVDATEMSISRYISNNDIQNLLGNLPARHVLIVADACFAGDIFRGQTISIPWENTSNYYKEVAQRRSRKALTSGDEEPVLDGGRDGHSVFAYYFLQALKSVEGKLFDASLVYEKLRIPVTNNSDQVPQFQAIKGIGDEGGQFIFVRK